MPAPKGNKHAAKDPEEKAESILTVRCKRSDKSSWAKAAYPGKLSQWVTDTLNKAALGDSKGD